MKLRGIFSTYLHLNNEILYNLNMSTVARSLTEQTQGESEFSLTVTFTRAWDYITAPFAKGDLTAKFTDADITKKPTNAATAKVSAPQETDLGALALASAPTADTPQAIKTTGDHAIDDGNLFYYTPEVPYRHDPQVEQFQDQLSALGYSDLIKFTDGKFGPLTQNGVEAFQADHHDELTARFGPYRAGVMTPDMIDFVQEKFDALPKEMKIEHSNNTHQVSPVTASYNQSSLATTTPLSNNELMSSLLGGEGYRRLSSDYGPRTHPITGEVGKMHKGVDLAATEGTPVLSPAAGTIISMRKSESYGNVMEIKHGPNKTTLYAHLKDLPDHLRVGQKVDAGQKIAEVGNTGWSTGAHLHFEFKINGQQVNPDLLRNYLPNTESDVLFAQSPDAVTLPSANMTLTNS